MTEEEQQPQAAGEDFGEEVEVAEELAAADEGVTEHPHPSAPAEHFGEQGVDFGEQVEVAEEVAAEEEGEGAIADEETAGA